jgi:hypothetical protein
VRSSLGDSEELPRGQRGVPYGTARSSLRDIYEFPRAWSSLGDSEQFPMVSCGVPYGFHWSFLWSSLRDREEFPRGHL